MKTKYPHLLTPVTIKGVTFKNRMMVGPLGGNVQNTGGYLHQENIDFYERIAMGGTSRVITGDHPVNSTNAGYFGGAGRLAFYAEDMQLRQLMSSVQAYAAVMHKHDVVAFSELEHEGISASCPPPHGPMGPSACKSPEIMGSGMMAKEMTQADIDGVIDDFAKCSKVGKDAGLDGMMIHGGHGKIIDQFRSQLFNRRTDKYGGSLENRCRFGIELLREVRSRVGPEFLIELRLSGDEGGFPGGITADESVAFLKLIDGMGLIDMIHLSAGIHFWPQYNMRVAAPSFFPNFYNLPVAEKIKAAGIKTPLGIINAVNDPDRAEQIIAEGKADFVFMARQLMIADPYFPQKVMDGKPERIDRCIRCFACYDGTECAVNPITTGKYLTELNYPVPKTSNPRKVLIIGGGIAGLKAADTAACRGHRVILTEKENYLGGILRFADTDAYKFDLRAYKNNIIRRVEQAGNIEIRLNTRVTPEYVEIENPYAVIVAAGARTVRPDLPGANGKNVLDVMDVYDYPEKVGERVVMVGGGLTGCETGMHLGKTGHKVTIVCRRDRLIPHEVFMPFFNPIPSFMEEYAGFKKPTDVLLNTDVTAIYEGGVTCRNKDGKEFSIGCDTVVLASTRKDNRDYAYTFIGTAPYIRIAGDCREPKKLKQAVPSAYYAAMDIG